MGIPNFGKPPILEKGQEAISHHHRKDPLRRRALVLADCLMGMRREHVRNLLGLYIENGKEN